jgi:hypothetical protein
MIPPDPGNDCARGFPGFWQEDRMKGSGRRGRKSAALAAAALAAAVIAAGCGGSSSATPETIYVTPGPGATPIVTAAPPEIGNVVISQTAPDGRWTVIFKKPVVSGISTDLATKINDAIAAKVAGYISDFTSSDLPALATGKTASTLDGNFTIAYDSLSVISLRFSILTFVSGATHSTGKAGSVTFDASGSAVALADLFTSSNDALSILTSKSKQALTDNLGSDLKWPSGSIALSFFEKTWTITSAGLEFTWDQGAIASDASGSPSAVVKWSDLKPVIKPKGAAGQFIG